MGTDDEGSDIPHGIWPEIRRICEQLILINSKLDNIAPKIDDHESRLRKLEERRFPYSSLAALGAVLSVVIAAISIYLNK